MHVNFVAVLVTGVVIFVLGGLWYSPVLFARRWVALMGKTEAEMKEWVEHTVERLLDPAPRRVLEIGCGTGMLLLRVARRCTAGAATDFSPEALAYVRGRRADADAAVRWSPPGMPGWAPRERRAAPRPGT